MSPRVVRKRSLLALTYASSALLAITSCGVPGLRVSEAGRLAATTADSLQILTAAKADQKAFEILRRSRMLFLAAATPYPRCGEVVGRYCVEEPAGVLSRIVEFPEDPDVTAARLRLTEGLQAAARRIPGDRWISGQMVRYLVESGDAERAITAISEGCQVEPLWWCTALLGYALHHGGRSAEAESVFRVTLSAMAPGERAAWLSPLLVLDDESRAGYLGLAEEDRALAGAHFWILADPLWTREGNEVFSEHLSRWIETDLQIGSEPIEGSPWGEDLIELMVRYGTSPQWIRGIGASAWEYELRLGMASVDRWTHLNGDIEIPESVFTTREGMIPEIDQEESAATSGIPVVGYSYIFAPPRGIRDLMVRYTPPRQSLLPPGDVLFSGTMTAGDWDVEEDLPLSGYDISMGGTTVRWFSPLAHQIAVFPRGDSVVVVAAYDLPAHGVPAGARVDAGFALFPAGDGLGDLRVARADGSSGTGVFALAAEAVPSFLSLELVIPEEEALARVRYGVDLSPRPAGVPLLTDMLVLREGALPETLPDAVAAARPSNRALPGEDLVIYWELHGLDLLEISEVPVSLALHNPPRGGLVGAFQWLGETIGLVGEPTPVRTSWLEEVGEGSFMGRSIGFRLPEEGEGRYLIELRVELPGREPLVSLQEVEVTRSVLPPSRPAVLVRRPVLTRIAGSCGQRRPDLRCSVEASDPSIYGHYGGRLHLGTFGYDGW